MRPIALALALAFALVLVPLAAPPAEAAHPCYEEEHCAGHTYWDQPCTYPRPVGPALCKWLP